MKRLLLIVPKCNGPGNNKKWNTDWSEDIENSVERAFWKVVTPGILLIASLTDRNKYEIDIVDEEFEEAPEKHYDLVGMYVITPNANRAYYLANKYRNHGAYIVFGGVHVKALPDEAKNQADTIIIGEAEIVWRQFLNDFECREPKNLYIQENETIDINSSPVPAYDLINETDCKILPLQTARGCPHGCKFCNLRSLYGNSYRFKDNSVVEKELNFARSVGGNSWIYFTDDNFFCDKRRARSILDTISSFNVSWFTHTDISFGSDENLIKKAFRSGCRQVLIGIESINKKSLMNLDENNFKVKNLERYTEFIKLIQDNGIGVVGSFIIGLPNDDISVLDDTLEFINDSELFSASITVNTPYPGTISYEEMNKKKQILSYNWDEYTIFQPVTKIYNMSRKELNSQYTKILEDVYSDEKFLHRADFIKKQYKLSTKAKKN